MPEGHTIHRIAREHQKWFAGSKVAVYSPQGRFENSARKVNGKRLRDVTAHGKHLFYHWTRQTIAHVHLGLYGKFRRHKNPAPEPRGAVRVRMIGSQRTFDLNGPNCCELINQKKLREVKSRLGQDPLCADASPEIVWDQVRRSRAAIGSLLLNQSVIAGIGNVYRAEILFLTAIHPDRPANELGRDKFDELWQLTVDLLRIGVKYNRIITVDHGRVQRPLGQLSTSERLNIYKKRNCPECGSSVRSWELANRKIFACETCQI